jgi:arylsulfatase
MMKNSMFAVFLSGALLLHGTLVVTTAVAQEDNRPNVLLIMADDMGYTDLGSFGSEIRTPNLDSLALGGVRLTNYHVGPACSQTRTMLLSGTYTELGAIPTGQGNNRVLAPNVVALPQLMKDAGYHTYMSGKWHVGDDAGDNPATRGFESSFALMSGSAKHFIDNRPYLENGQLVGLPDNFYSTSYYTDKMIEYMQANEGDDVPFFAWYTPTSPHWPMQVPDDYLHRYDGLYDQGYDELVRRRVQRASEMGVLPQGVSLENYTRSAQWSDYTAEERHVEARKMELHAAMVENLDYHVGRLIRYLRESGQFDNTIIVFSSDNGADVSVRTIDEEVDNSYENLGRPGSYVSTWSWGDSISAPYRWNKGTQFEGGLRVPAFIYHDSLVNRGGVNREFLTVMDLMPTFLEIAGSAHPGTEYEGHPVLPARGRSFLNSLRGSHEAVHDETSTGTWYSSALYRGDWKLVRGNPPRGNGEWELYNLREDPSETTNLSMRHPEIRTDMLNEWARIGRAADAPVDFSGS